MTDQMQVLETPQEIDVIQIATQGPPGRDWETFPGGFLEVSVPSSAIIPTKTNGCIPFDTVAGAANQPDIGSLGFTGGVSSHGWFEIPFPKRWNRGDIFIEFYWTSLQAGAGDVVWGATGLAASDGDTLAANFGSPDTVIDTFMGVQLSHKTVLTAGMTFAGLPQIADTLLIDVFRQGDSASDTKLEVVNLRSIKVRYGVNALVDN